MKGKVLKIFITKNDKDKTRLLKENIYLDENGIIDDKFYAKDIDRSILITSKESYELSLRNNINIEYGSLGENLLIDINPYHLNHLDKIIIGDTVLEITQHCSLCKGLSNINSKLPKLLKNDRGIFAKVIQGKSTISIGDIVKF